jgi:hypothetical protein
MAVDFHCCTRNFIALLEKFLFYEHIACSIKILLFYWQIFCFTSKFRVLRANFLFYYKISVLLKKISVLLDNFLF